MGSACDPSPECLQAPAGRACSHLEHRLTSLGEGTGNNYAYLVTDDKTKQAVVIDPANPSELVLLLHPSNMHSD